MIRQIAGAALLAGAVTGCATLMGANQPVTMNLASQNNSGESGTAVLTPDGNQTKVQIKLSGAPAGIAQPAHIHEGNCRTLDPKPKYGLSNVVNGASTTTVPVELSTLLKGNFAINVHKSASELTAYVACGEIRG